MSHTWTYIISNLSWVTGEDQPHILKVDWFWGYIYQYTPPPSLRPWYAVALKRFIGKSTSVVLRCDVHGHIRHLDWVAIKNNGRRTRDIDIPPRPGASAPDAADATFPASNATCEYITRRGWRYRRRQLLFQPSLRRRRLLMMVAIHELDCLLR